ncbi:MAG: hypothetical protein V8Q42_13390 [Anaerovoracaceae bacterium]
MNTSDYIYIENDSLDVYYNFALEYYLTSEKLFRDKTVFLIWRTTPTVMVGKFQNTYEEINQAYVDSKDINVVRRMSGGGTIFTDLGGMAVHIHSTGRRKQHKLSGVYRADNRGA